MSRDITVQLLLSERETMVSNSEVNEAEQKSRRAEEQLRQACD